MQEFLSHIVSVLCALILGIICYAMPIKVKMIFTL